VSTAMTRNLMAEMKLLGMLNAFDKTVTDATRDHPAGAVARWDSHPLESAALSRRTPRADLRKLF
jgi:hypothetical protein